MTLTNKRQPDVQYLHLQLTTMSKQNNQSILHEHQRISFISEDHRTSKDRHYQKKKKETTHVPTTFKDPQLVNLIVLNQIYPCVVKKKPCTRHFFQGKKKTLPPEPSAAQSDTLTVAHYLRQSDKFHSAMILKRMKNHPFLPQLLYS